MQSTVSNGLSKSRNVQKYVIFLVDLVQRSSILSEIASAVHCSWKRKCLECNSSISSRNFFLFSNFIRKFY